MKKRRHEVAIARGVDCWPRRARSRVGRQGLSCRSRSSCRQSRRSRAASRPPRPRRAEPGMIATERGGVREEKCATRTGWARRRCVYADDRVACHLRLTAGDELCGFALQGVNAPARRAGDRPRPARCDRPVWRRLPAPIRSTSLRSTNEWTSSSGVPEVPGFQGFQGSGFAERDGSRRASSRIAVNRRVCRASSREIAPAASSASAQARLPVTSSSNSRRSKRNDAPQAKIAASGKPEAAAPQRARPMIWRWMIR